MQKLLTLPAESRKVYTFNEPQHRTDSLSLKNSTWIKQIRLLKIRL